MKYLIFFIFNLVLFGQVGMAQEFNDNDFAAKDRPKKCDDDEVAVYGTSSHGEGQAIVAAEKAAASKPSSSRPSQQWIDFCVEQKKVPNHTEPPKTNKGATTVVESDDVGTTVRICVKFTCK